MMSVLVRDGKGITRSALMKLKDLDYTDGIYLMLHNFGDMKN